MLVFLGVMVLPFVVVYSAGSGDDACDPDGAETLADGGAEEIWSMSSGPEVDEVQGARNREAGGRVM